jgi:hypothetical protein
MVNSSDCRAAAAGAAAEGQGLRRCGRSGRRSAARMSWAGSSHGVAPPAAAPRRSLGAGTRTTDLSGPGRDQPGPACARGVGCDRGPARLLRRCRGRWLATAAAAGTGRGGPISAPAIRPAARRSQAGVPSAGRSGHRVAAGMAVTAGDLRSVRPSPTPIHSLTWRWRAQASAASPCSGGLSHPACRRRSARNPLSWRYQLGSRTGQV